MTYKIKILGQNLALCEGHFDHFGVKKSRFLDFLKVGLELFRSCLGIVFGLKRPTFRFIFSLFYTLVSPLGSRGSPTSRKTAGFD